MKTILTILAIVAAVPTLALEVGEMAQCVVLDGFDSGGKPHTGCIRDHETPSQKFTVIKFGLSYCSTCNASIPALSRFAVTARELATTRSVYSDKNTDDVLKHLKEHGNEVTFAVALDPKQFATDAYDVHSFPIFFVLDNKNRVVFKHKGLFTDETAQDILELMQGR